MGPVVVVVVLEVVEGRLKFSASDEELAGQEYVAKLPKKLSMYPFCQGLSGWMNWFVAPSGSVMARNSGPLSHNT